MAHTLKTLTALYTADEVRALDRTAIERHGIPGIVLMQRAGRALWRLVQQHYGAEHPLHIVCGSGNNGGDGFVLARLAHERGRQVSLLLLGDAGRIRDDARIAFNAALRAGVQPQSFDPSIGFTEGLIVDALLGTGLSGEVRAAHGEAIRAINASGLPVIAVDVPSGLCSDSGCVRGEAVRATYTLSFIGRKRGLYTAQAADHCGELHFDALDAPSEIYVDIEHGAELLELDVLLQLLPRRARTAHKGHYGHVLVIGGERGMAGAAVMAAEAAARCGAGLVSVATRTEHAAAMVMRCPEIMARGIEHAHELDALLERATVVVAGPGLGRGAWGQQLLQRALAANLPTVLDADALNELADPSNIIKGQANWLISPHPGEAARLLGVTSGQINQDRYAAVAALRERFPGAVVLKGAGTLVAGGCGAAGRTGVSPYGNPGMASGGMGDVLSGVLAAMLAQGLDLAQAARLGVCLHGRAADLAASCDGERGLLATDLLPWLRRLLNPGAADV